MSAPAVPSRPIVAVLGASGVVGQAVVRALLARGRYAVRALSAHGADRSPAAGSTARELQRAGADWRAVDLDDPADLRRAFAFTHGVFAITAFDGCAERELQQAHHIAKAAADAHVAHLVWSTREDTRRWVRLDDPRLPTHAGRWKVPSFDAKGAANQRFRDLGVPSSFLYSATPWEHLLAAACPVDAGPGGALRLRLPLAEQRWPGIAAGDIGHCVAAIFERGSWTVGRSIGIAGEHLSGEQIAQAMRDELGLPVQLEVPGLDAVAALDVPHAAALAARLRFQQLFDTEYRARRSVAEARSLHPGVLDFAGWLRTRGGRPATAPEAGRMKAPLGWLRAAVAAVLGLLLAGAAAVPPERRSALPLQRGSAPPLLSQTGFGAPGVIGFEPQYPLWSDGTSKRRWLHLPPGRFIDARKPDAWVFPIGTRLWKEFAYGSRVETRFNERLANGQWRFVTYVWRADGSDADLAPAAGAVLARGDAPQGRYELPSAADCANCHAGARSPVLGFDAIQVAGLLPALIERGLVRGLPASLRTATPRIAAASDAEREARGYLHGNCGHCHHAGGVPVPLVLAQSVAGTPPPSVAQLERALSRMQSRNPLTQMPPLGTRVADPRGLALVQGWLDHGLGGGNEQRTASLSRPP